MQRGCLSEKPRSCPTASPCRMTRPRFVAGDRRGRRDLQAAQMARPGDLAARRGHRVGHRHCGRQHRIVHRQVDLQASDIDVPVTPCLLRHPGNPSFARDTGMLRIPRSGQPLLIERLAFDMTDLGDQLALQVTARRDVAEVVSAGTSLLNRSPEGGAVFLETVCCGTFRVAGPSPVYARQLNTEGGRHAHHQRWQPVGDPWSASWWTTATARAVRSSAAWCIPWGMPIPGYRPCEQ